MKKGVVHAELKRRLGPQESAGSKEQVKLLRDCKGLLVQLVAITQSIYDHKRAKVSILNIKQTSNCAHGVGIHSGGLICIMQFLTKHVSFIIMSIMSSMPQRITTHPRTLDPGPPFLS
jgi:hypothetical protein